MENETASTEKTSLFQDTMTKGFILGAIHIIVFIALYYTDSSKLAGFVYLFFVIGLNIGYCLYYNKQYRTDLGGYISFGEVFKYAFLILAFNGLLSSLIVPIAFSFIDAGYAETMAQAQMDSSIYWAGKFGAPEASLDQMRNQMDITELSKRYTATGTLMGYGIALIFYALGAVIVGFIGRKSQPEMM